MRRKDREITDIKEILKIITLCKVCRLGLSDNGPSGDPGGPSGGPGGPSGGHGGRPYIVPLNYGWNYDNNTLTFYFHSATEGKKIDIIRNNNHACLEIDTDHELYVEGAEACKHGYLFTSVIAHGLIEFINEPEEKTYALNMIMKHQTEKDTEYDYSNEALARVAVYKFIAGEFSGKARHKPH